MENYKTAKIFDAGGDLSKRWYVHYSFRSPETGKFHLFQNWIPQKIKTCSGRRDKAHEMIKDINRRLRQGFNPFAYSEKKNTSILVALEYVLSIKEGSCRKRSFFTYRSMVRLFIVWLKVKNLLNIPVDDFNYHLAQEYMDYTQAKMKYCNRTYNNRATALKTVFKALVKREWILVNPFDKVERLPKEEAEIVSFTVEDLVKMQKNLPAWDYDLYVCACLIFYCFIRPQEIVRLKVSHFQLKNRTIMLPGTISKNKKNELVQIPNAMVPVLEKLDLNYPGSHFVFTRHLKRGTKEAAPTRIAGAWRKFANHFGIDKNIYSLKHTGAGMAIENGINVRDLQLQLRHSSLEITQIYLDKFNKRPSEKLATNFPDLARLDVQPPPLRTPRPTPHTTPPLPGYLFKPGMS